MTEIAGATGASGTWRHALIQHPMYLIIREDDQCAERTPPWGEATIEDYVRRLRRSLDRLEERSGLKIAFEWSAMELEMLAADAPEVLQAMARLAAAGRVTFHNGTYAQPHLQVLSSEANILQFEMGGEVYGRLGLPPVMTYAHQESSVHDQVPQLLDAFGLRYAVMPHFVATLADLNGAELVSTSTLDGLRFVHGDEFVQWRGLDGTRIPLYLCEPNDRRRELKAIEGVMGLLRGPAIQVSIRDMVDIDQWLAEHGGEELVLLDQALPDRYEVAPARATARFSTNWSYVEGIGAEALSRADHEAQVAVRQAEAATALARILVGAAGPSVGALWREILRWEHHDVYCFASPGLKAQAVPKLRQVVRDAEAATLGALNRLGTEVRSDERPGIPILLVNPLPHRVRCPVRLPDGGEAVVDMAGLGYRVLYLPPGGGRVTEGPAKTGVTFEGQYYRARLEPDGTVSSLSVVGTGIELIDVGSGGGNRLTATDSDGLSPAGLSTATLNPEAWTPPLEPPKKLAWEATAPAMVRRSALGLALCAQGRFSERIRADVIVSCYSALPWMSIEWTFQFDDASVGTFFDDESKLLAHWSFGFEGALWHDIPCGAVQARAGRPLFPTRWLDYSNGEVGVGWFHFGTPKHWLLGRRLSGLIAWGEQTDAIGNRIEVRRWRKSFDQRLRGVHRIRYAIHPHRGDWRQATLPRVAESVAAPIVVAPLRRGRGTLPGEATVLEFMDPAVACTAVRWDDGSGSLRCRVFESHGEEARLNAALNGLRQEGLVSLRGDSIERLSPFQIGIASYQTSSTSGGGGGPPGPEGAG
jgi:hypothetical protein